MNDLISRADAVKTVIRKCSPICAWQVGTQQYPDCVIAEINALPSAEADWIPREHFDVLKKNYDMLAGLLEEAKARAIGAWIPCSERLPEQSNDYICTIPLDAEETFVKVLTFHKGRFYEDDDEWGATIYDDVIAWQPLPKPYRKDGDK